MLGSGLMFESVLGTPGTRILVVAAHADDEVLGVGGTIHRACTEWGAKVSFAIAADGRGTRNGAINLDQVREAALSACSRIGASEVIFGGLGMNPDRPLDPFEVSGFVTESLRKLSPNVVFAHFDGDINIEHTVLNQATTYSLARPEFAHTVTLALEYEVPSSTERNPRTCFTPSLWVNLPAASMQAKQEAFAAYIHEQEAEPCGRSAHGIRALAAYRGMQVGVEFCEAFHITRGIAT